MAHRTALIVDDEADLRLLMAEFLREEGWETLEAEDGDTAVALAAIHMPEVILLDVHMPGADGFAIFKELRDDYRTAHIPVIFVTAINEIDLGGHHDAGTITAKLGITPDAFIEKPFEQDRIRQALTEILGGEI